MLLGGLLRPLTPRMPGTGACTLTGTASEAIPDTNQVGSLSGVSRTEQGRPLQPRKPVRLGLRP